QRGEEGIGRRLAGRRRGRLFGRGLGGGLRRGAAAGQQCQREQRQGERAEARDRAEGAHVDAALESDLGAAGAGSAGLLPPSARLRFLSPSFLKSVSYQPPPARRNDGAVTWRRTWPPALQAGQVSGSASESFCRRSKAWPQAAHWNA